MSNIWIPLGSIAHARSGDKGDMVNIGIIARNQAWYPLLKQGVTSNWLAEAWGDEVHGRIKVFEVPGIGALNCTMDKALQGGGTVSMKTDAQGKSMGQTTLTVRIHIDRELAERLEVPLDEASQDRMGSIPIPVLA
ncbi:MAG: hypothetical protein QF817_02930 [Candidatus Poseidoniaceae archaeon]|nr:hypothetical protein [Candidatus Poseidoniaceae archaeon]